MSDLVCLSHLRWDFVYQRPNHLMARAARDRRVFFVEEPIAGADEPRLELTDREGVTVVVPHLPGGLDAPAVDAALGRLMAGLFDRQAIREPVLWYLTPMAVAWTDALPRSAVVYDCMDELSMFRGAPAGLRHAEAQLLARADVVFTGGARLYASKRSSHPNVHCFPSSVDGEHFATARQPQDDPPDQASIPRPRLGYFGVIDERIDLALIGELAARHPAWQIVLVGPTAKIDEAEIPSAPNIHRLGPKPYRELPRYLAGWDVGIMPFAHNESTSFISPTKTPEYLAGGRPVVSTSIHDVVRPYGAEGLVHIGDGVAAFAEAIERALAEDRRALMRRADAYLAQTSWDRTWHQMASLVDDAVRRHALAADRRSSPARRAVAVPIVAGHATPSVTQSPARAGAVE